MRIRLKYRIIDFMNILEVIAISIENDTLDYDTINDMYSNIFEEYWVQMAPYVSALRASDFRTSVMTNSKNCSSECVRKFNALSGSHFGLAAT